MIVRAYLSGAAMCALGMIAFATAAGMLDRAAASETTEPSPVPMAASVEQLAQGIVGRCSGIDPADFASIDAFVEAVVAASGGFADAAAEQHSIDCAETLQLAGKIRDIDNPPVTVAIRRLVADCEASDATVRTCSALRAVLHEAILGTSEPEPPIEKPGPFVVPQP